MFSLIASDVRRGRRMWCWMLVTYVALVAIIAASVLYLVGNAAGHGTDTAGTTDTDTGIKISASQNGEGGSAEAASQEAQSAFATTFMEADGGPGQSLELSAIANPFSVLLVLSLFLSVFVSEDFSTGFIRGLLPAGISRRRYYVGKVMTMLVLTLVWTLLFLALFWASMRLAGFGFQAEDPGRLMAWVVLSWLLTFFYVLLCCVATWFFQSRLAGVITACVVAGGIASSLVSTLGGLLRSEAFDAIVQWLPHQSAMLLGSGGVTRLFQSSLEGVTLAPLAHVSVTVAVGIAMLLAVTLLVVPHRDIH